MSVVEVKTKIRLLNNGDTVVDLLVEKEETVKDPRGNKKASYFYKVNFTSRNELIEKLEELVLEAIIQSNAILATQLYNEIIAVCNCGDFISVKVDVEIVLEDSFSKSFITVEKQKLQAIQYTNGYIGKLKDYGTWFFTRNGTWTFKKNKFFIQWNGEKIHYSFEFDPKHGVNNNLIESTIYGAIKEANRMLKLYFG